MTGSITTCMVNSFKQEIFEGGHCFFASLVQTGNTNANTLVTNLAATANLAVGMGASGTGVNASAVIAGITNTSTLSLSNPGTSQTGTSITFSADTFKVALIAFALTGTYNRGTNNYANVVSNSDEVSGAGYSAGGVALVQVNPSVPDSNTAIVSFGNPSWTSATIDSEGCIIYNASARISNTTGRAVGLFDFGGEQKVTAGTFTINMPTANGTAAILRIA